VALTVSCAASAPRAEGTGPLRIEADSVDSVVFLVGDAGEALPGRSPVTAKLALEVERWSAGPGPAAVAVFFLGDNVYPEGVREPGHPAFSEDSLRLLSQVRVVAGEPARGDAVRGTFVAGNHDWGLMTGEEGLRRLRNQSDLLGSFRESGAPVDMTPEPGEPGPVVVDVGARARFIVLDTQWWLYDQPQARRDSVLHEVATAIRTADGRHVAVAAHHPLVSGGRHGAGGSVWQRLGVLWLLGKTGALIQDLNSAPYRELQSSLRSVFASAGRPLLFVGGHDHSLQVIEQVADDRPRWSLVSGAGSKLTPVGPTDGMVWGLDRPGFMKLTFMRDGAVHLHVLITGEDLGVCDSEDGPLDACMRRGADAFEIGYSTTLATSR